MKASTIFATCLVAAGSALAQNAAAVLNAISLISNTTSQLQSDVSNYNSTVQGLPWALQVQQDSIIIYRQVNAGKAAADSSAKFSSSDSSSVSTALINVSNKVKSTLTTTQNKATTFGDLGPLVRVSLYQLKKATDLFSNSTIAKLQPAQASAAPAIKKSLDDAFNNAIVAYGGKATSG